MHRNSYHTSSSSGPPPHQPPPPGYDRYDSYPPPPPPTSLPPPPPPPPQQQQQWDRHDTRDGRNGRDGRDRRDGYDGYNGYNSRDRNDGYRFRGPYSDLRQPRGPGPYRDSRDEPRDYRDSRDDYPPPRGEFTFRQEAPPGIGSYRRPSNMRYDAPGLDHRQHRPTNAGRSHDDRGANNHTSRYDETRRPGRDQRPYPPRRSGPYQRREKEKAADRLLLSKRFDDQSELMLGDTAVRATYRDVDELSDSDEVDMDISDNGDSDSNAVERPAKRARTDASEAPKWSNPDPYTALPPPETTRKKDVVQLIRKARVEAEAAKPSVPTEAADFISCDFSDEESSSQVRRRGTEALQHDASTRVPLLPPQPRAAASTSTLPPKPPAPLPTSTPHQSSKVQPTQPQPPNHVKRGNRRSASVDLTPSASLGSRKRTIDDEILLPLKPPHAPLKKVNRMASGGQVDIIWRPVPGEDPCPWEVEDHSGVLNMGTRLHLEVRDFYEYVRPRDFEERVRQQLVATLETLVHKKWRTANIFPFGSFMSGLYLPTADMDIAICSQDFIDGKSPVYDKKKFLFQMKFHLEMFKVPFRGVVEAITKAKVPLLKYTDDYTGLKVDISFEKLDGYKAIDTFRKWKEQYPAMPPLVAIIKHFLLMRGLNEPVSGGIGGFTVICMVVHLLQMMPQVQSRSMKDEHLGELLMEFLNYYGKRFNYEKVAIRMDPPGTLNKAKASTLVYRNLDRLSIIDPNNPENDISGGSQNFYAIRDRFAKAYDSLQETMMQLAREPASASSDRKNKSLLSPLFAGNYAHFRDQRNWLQKLDGGGLSKRA